MGWSLDIATLLLFLVCGQGVSEMIVREVTDPEERERLWDLSVATYPPYADYQAKTERVIPVFLAEPKQSR